MKGSQLKKIGIRIILSLAVIYVLICTLFYFFQEKLIFFPDKLDKNYKFSFMQPFAEINIKSNDGNLLNGLLFTSGSRKGLIFYLHGNAGALNKWGKVAKTYTDLGYDVFIPDYPGYGKSVGSVKSQEQLYEDLQLFYDEMKIRYSEDSIVVLGYSIGSGPAAKLASANSPKLLILQAPYYSLTDMLHHYYPFLPGFLLRYKFNTNEYLKQCNMPVVVFHGNKDEVIYYGSSLKLKNEMKPSDTLIILPGQGHADITDNPDYVRTLTAILK